MPKYFNAAELLQAANESMGFAPAVEEEVPGTVEDSVPAQAALTEQDKANIFMMLLKGILHHDFASYVSENAVDLEVYGFIPSADATIAAINAYMAKKEAGKDDMAVKIAALRLAVNAGSPLVQQYADAEAAEHAALSAIFEQFGEQARTALREMIDQDVEKTRGMNGPLADRLPSYIEQMREMI